MKRQAGVSLIELLITVAVIMGMMGSILALATTARASANEAELRSTVLAIVAAMSEQAEWEPVAAGYNFGGDNMGERLVQRHSELARFYDPTAYQFHVQNVAVVSGWNGQLSITRLSTAQCVELATALQGTLPARNLSVNTAPLGTAYRTPAALIAQCAARPGRNKQHALINAYVY